MDICNRVLTEHIHSSPIRTIRTSQFSPFPKDGWNTTVVEADPTLAVVAGPALGAGCLLAASCDIVLAGESAKFAHPEIRGGVFNAMAAAMLPRIVGRKRAFEMLMLGTTLSAAEGVRAGLVTRKVADDGLEAEAAATIQRFAESSAPIVQLARRAIVGGQDLSLEDAISHAEDVYLNQLMATEDVAEGLRAVAEKRKPDWKGR